MKTIPSITVVKAGEFTPANGDLVTMTTGLSPRIAHIAEVQDDGSMFVLTAGSVGVLGDDVGEAHIEELCRENPYM